MAWRKRRMGGRRRRGGKRRTRFAKFRSVRRPKLNLVSNTFGGFPLRKLVKLRYCDCVQITPGAYSANVGYHMYSANSINDPDTTGIGHQPMGHDTWQAIYNYYVVVGAKIRVTFSPTSQEDGGVINIVGIGLDDQGTISAPARTIMERGKYSYRVFNPSQSAFTSGISITKYYSARKFHNVVNMRDNIDNLGAVFGANPSDQAYFSIFVGGMTSSASDPINCTVCIEYLVWCSQPKDQSEN